MSRLGTTMLLLPTPAAAAVMTAWVLIGTGGVAVLVVGIVGIALTSILFAERLRRQASQLARLVGAIADGEGSTPDVGTFGGLKPIAEAVDKLAERLLTAQEAATTDRLTRVANRGTLFEQLFQEVERATRYGRPLAIAFIDIDHFKTVNDTYGHDIGDQVLRAVADLFRKNTRDVDLVARYGGEEFVIILPETSIDEATAVVEKLRLMVMKHRIRTGPGEEISVSVSIGLAGGQGQNLRVDQLLRDADAAMYSAKSLGRNQTYTFAEIDDDAARIPRSPISPASRARAAEVGDIGRHAAEAALAAVITPMPHYRGKPSSLIAAIAVRMARRLDLPEQEIERIRVASLLHDIGKVGVPAHVLEKPGPLSPDEWQAVVQHPQIGQVIINRVAAVKDAGAIILHHHERFSGHGYPHGLRGADIPLGARIVSIADAYDAMVHDRPYKDAIAHEAAIRELRAHAGLQFDPDLVDLFCALFGDEVPVPDSSLLVTPPTAFMAPDQRSQPHAHPHGRRAASF